MENINPSSPEPYSPLQSGSGPVKFSPLAPLSVKNVDNLNQMNHMSQINRNNNLNQLDNIERRGVHPRGCRFRDLGEAHRNITGRSISAAYSLGATCRDDREDLSSNTDNHHSDMVLASPRRNVTSPMTFGAPAVYEASSPPQLGSPFGPHRSGRPKHGTPKNKGPQPADAATPEEMIDQIFGVNRSNPKSSPSPATVTTPSSYSRRPDSPRPQFPTFPDLALLPALPLEDSFHDDNEKFSPLNLHTIPNHNRSSGSHMVMTVDSKDTTVRMYKQYQEFLLNQPSPTPVHIHKVLYRREAEGRAGNRQDGPHYLDGDHILDLAPTGPESPDNANAVTTNATRPQSMFMSMPTRESLMYPKPLRVQSIRAENKHNSLCSGSVIAVSGTGMTTDSEEDPFRYDRDAYKVFLHPSKERDLSTALQHIGGLSSHSQATLHGMDNNAMRQIPQRPPPIPKEYLADDPFCSGPTRARSATPESGDGFYDTSVIQPNWAVERGEYEVKVVLQDVSRNSSMNASSRPSGDLERKKAQNDFYRSSFMPPQVNKNNVLSPSRQKYRENVMPSSEREDWETVATSVPGLGSMQLPLPPIPSGYGTGRNSRGHKVTGSSVADVSDDGSYSQMNFNEYASTDRIVQHPSGHEDSEESLQIRNLSGTKVPIMIPKQRVHRVNGFAQNTSRMLPQTQLSSSEAAAALARKVASPFRQLSNRRARPFSPTPLANLPYKLEKGKSKFEFQQSCQGSNSDRDTFGSKQVYEFKGVSSETGNTGTACTTNNTRSDTFAITLSNNTANQVGDGYSLRDSGSSTSSHRTMHSFPFPLIPLPEAARKEAVRRQTRIDAGDFELRPYWDKNGQTKGHRRLSSRIDRLENDGRRARQSYHRSPTQFFSSMFGPSATTTQSSCYRTQRHSRMKKSRAIANDLTVPSTIDTPTSNSIGVSDRMPQGVSTWASFIPFGSSSGPTHFLRSAATKLHLDELGRKLNYQLKHSDFTFGSSSILSRGSTPRLYPWDYTLRRQRQREREEREERRTDPELRAIAEPECQRIRGFHSSRHGASKHMLDLERTGVPLDPEAFLSWKARHRRKVWFYCVLVASMFPFISVLVYTGKFNSALSWFTRGEVNRLNNQQRRAIFLVMILQFVLWPIVLGVVIWRTMI